MDLGCEAAGQPSTLNQPPSTLHCTPSTLHSTPYALHPTHYALHLPPFTLQYTSSALHPRPCTIHPTPSTLHPTLARLAPCDHPRQARGCPRPRAFQPAVRIAQVVSEGSQTNRTGYELGLPYESTSSSCRCRTKRGQLKRLQGRLPESQRQNLALTGLYVPNSLDSATTGCYSRQQARPAQSLNQENPRRRRMRNGFETAQVTNEGSFM